MYATRNTALIALLALAWPTAAQAGAPDLAGYFRVAGRPDFQGGDGRLGYWNLYGRLLNESSWALVDLRVAIVEPNPDTDDPWTSVHARVEGGSIAGADSGNGRLANLRLTQVYVKAGNVLGPVEWQFGTMEWYYGDLGLYDMRPASLFSESVGVLGKAESGKVQAVFGVGDAGYSMRPDAYNPIVTPGAGLRLRLGKVELGAGGQAFYEPKVEGKRTALYSTPDLPYEDYVRSEVLLRWQEDNPALDPSQFPDPVARSALSWKAVGYLGFGDVGPLVWTNVFASVQLRHPERLHEETFSGDAYDVYVADLTDERTVVTVGQQTQLRLVPDKLDAVWSAIYGRHTDGDNSIAVSDHARWYGSTVLRGQLYVTPTVHLLAEGSAAREVSLNGNAFRDHKDSVFKSTDGLSDARGLAYGDDAIRDTWQAKGGVVLNPLGPGIFVRPSLRVLYGGQWSSQNNAFGNAFVESLDQNNQFGSVERHWHHILSFETEVWF